LALDRKVSPAIGRGYSHATGSYLATCIQPMGFTPSSFDYSFFMKSQSSDTAVDARLGGHGGLGDVPLPFAVVVDIEAEIEANFNHEQKNHYIIAFVSLDRYHNSLDESSAVMSRSAEILLEEYDLISFVQSCGPTFVRGIRRTSELVIKFTFKSMMNNWSIEGSVQSTTGTRVAKGMDDDGFFGTSANRVNIGTETTFRLSVGVGEYKLKEQTEIKIWGYGLDMDGGHSFDRGYLFATNLDEFEAAMSGAFNMMLNPLVGRVESIDVVPWIDNVQFQGAVELDMSLTYTDGGLEKEYPSTMMAINFMANAEHISKMDTINRLKSNMLSSLFQCVSSLWRISYSKRCRTYVKNRWFQSSADLMQELKLASVNYNPATRPVPDWKVTKADGGIGIEKFAIHTPRLKTLLDGELEAAANTTAATPHLVARVTTLYKDWVEKYFGPCIRELQKDRYGMPGGVLFTKLWIEIPKCNKLTCLIDNAEWYQRLDTCTMVPSVVTPWMQLVDAFCMPETNIDESRTMSCVAEPIR